MDAKSDDRSIGQLFGDLSRQLSTLVRKEIELARTEVTSKAQSASRDAALIGVGGALIYAGFLGVMAAVIFGLVQAGLDPWLAALIVGLVVAIVGAVLVQRGRSDLAQANLAPERTVESIKDDAEWAKERMR